MIEFYCKSINTSYSETYKQNMCVVDISKEDFVRMLMNNLEMLDEIEPGDKARIKNYLDSVGVPVDKTCVIFGTEVEFQQSVSLSDIEAVCKDIWNHPSRYSEYRDGSAEAYNEFTKFLWVKFPDDHEERFVDIVDR